MQLISWLFCHVGGGCALGHPLLALLCMFWLGQEPSMVCPHWDLNQEPFASEPCPQQTELPPPPFTKMFTLQTLNISLEPVFFILSTPAASASPETVIDLN